MTEDHKLKENVLAELAWEPSISADHVGVTAANGVVTLTGHVDSYWQKQAAERAAGRVQGVKALVENIDIRLPVHIKRSDDEIANAALSRLSWDSFIPKDAVKIKVENGFLTLTGNVEWHYQKESVAESLRSLHGVTGIANQITAKMHPSTVNIDDDIRHALRRSWFFDEYVRVSAVGGKVHLTGEVDSWNDRQTAASVAWAAPGTTSVQNDILIR